jgi:phospholipid/cholesterol/gamma-HCH transport system permease protein
MHKFGTDLYVADMVGLSIVKELGPLMVAMICTGRAGSAFAAEISTMKVSEEIDAMVTMGFKPSRFLIIPKLLALVLVMPVLTIFGNVVGIIGGMTVGVFSLGLPVITYFNRTVLIITPRCFTEGLIKSAVFAILIAAVGCLRGLEAKNDTHGVGSAATSAVVSGIFLVIVADTLLTFLFSRI